MSGIATCCKLQWNCNGCQLQVVVIWIELTMSPIEACCNLDWNYIVCHCNLLQFGLKLQWVALQLAASCSEITMSGIATCCKFQWNCNGCHCNLLQVAVKLQWMSLQFTATCNVFAIVFHCISMQLAMKLQLGVVATCCKFQWICNDRYCMLVQLLMNMTVFNFKFIRFSMILYWMNVASTFELQIRCGGCVVQVEYFHTMDVFVRCWPWCIHIDS